MSLKVLARGSALVPRFDADDNAKTRRFTGRTFDPSIGVAGGWPAKSEPEEVPALAEFMFAVRDGDLWAADEATAAACGVKFDPKFGAE